MLRSVGGAGLRGLIRASGGRSAAAIRARLHRDTGSSSLRRGSLSLRQVCLTTGYSRTQLLRARTALGQRWRRTKRGGVFLITEEQRQEIVDWLAQDYWDKDRQLYGCLWCTTTTRPPKGLGLCGRCYFRHRRECGRRGLPTALEGLWGVYKGLDRGSISGNLLEKMEQRLRAGLALDLEHFDLMEMLDDRVATDP